ncbi:amidase family protein [Brevibacterium album]|uniref:amidase family protein n=1 Tax=Brevibacterium album TaxID=417948 RepID=UPI0004175414|nr:amidase family protein [Brevibacterium album]
MHSHTGGSDAAAPSTGAGSPAGAPSLPGPGTGGAEPADLSVAELTRAFAEGALTPEEALSSVQRRVDALEPTINALWASDLAPGSQAWAEAAAATRRYAEGRPLGPLDGVPVTVKENIAREGVAVPSGHAAGTPPVAGADAPIVARLRGSGAVIYSSTVMPDWGMLSSGVSSRHGITRSPLDPSLTTGGSSSGAGAAAAAGYGPVHIGTDIGGSIRLPGTWLGLATLKPSFGRVPLDAPYLGRCAGPLARRIADVRAAMQVIGRPDPRDFSELPPYDGDYSRPLSGASARLAAAGDRRVAVDRPAAGDRSAPLAGLRIAWHTEAGCGTETEPEVAEATAAAAALLAEAGAEVVEIPPFMEPALLADVDRFWRVRSWADFRLLSADDQRRILPHVARWCQRGADVSAVELMRCYHSIQRMRQVTVAATIGYDFVLSPVAPMRAFPAEDPMPFGDPDLPMTHIGFTVPYNMSEQPAATVDAGACADGRRVGIQVAGRRFDDAGVLSLAEELERLLG